MTILLAFLAGLVCGYAALWFAQRGQLQYLKDELTTAQDRLLGAWKEGAVIPTKEQVTPVKREPIDPLPPEYRQMVSDFSSAEAQSDVEDFIRQKRALGWSTARIREAIDKGAE